jgi:hypothetical protein
MPDFSNGAAYVDEQLVPIAEAKISILDWGFLHSDATYDVVHVWKGKFFRLDDHLNRFLAGIDKLHMSIPHNADDLRAILIDCVTASGLRDAYVEMICTRGMPAPGSRAEPWWNWHPNAATNSCSSTFPQNKPVLQMKCLSPVPPAVLCRLRQSMDARSVQVRPVRLHEHCGKHIGSCTKTLAAHSKSNMIETERYFAKRYKG